MDFQVCVYLQIVGCNIISTLLHISWQSKLSSWIYILHGIGKISGSERVKSVKSVKSVFDLVAQALGWKRCSFHMKDTFQVLPALQVSKYHSITESKYHSVKVSKYYRIKDITCTPHECLMFSQIYKSPEKLRRYSPTKENLVNQHQSSSIGSPVYVLQCRLSSVNTLVKTMYIYWKKLKINIYWHKCSKSINTCINAQNLHILA